MSGGIEIRGICKKYGDKWAVRPMELDVKQGELMALLGVNGAGKTTLINMLSCRTAPTSGDAFILGKSVVKEAGEVKEVMAKSPQQTAVAPKLTVRENLELMAGAYGYGKVQVRQRTEEMLDEMGLREVEKSSAYKLSGGWQRRLSIAMALISAPKVLFLDEPTLGLDVLARQELWQVVSDLKGKVTILLTTHYMEEAEELADRVCILNRGTPTALGTVEELKTRAGEESFEKAFIKLVNGGEKA